MSATLLSPLVVLPATLLSGLLLALMIVRLGHGEFPPALFRAAASLGVVMGMLILIAEAPFNLQANMRVFSPFLSAFGFAGFPEEAVKFAAVLFFLRPHYLVRTHRALVLGAAAVGLGFALTEDLLYIAKAGPQWGAIAASRALTAVPVHVFLGAIGGFAIARSALSTSRARAAARIAAAYLATSLLHGFYDLPQFVLNKPPPYPKAVEDLAGRLGVSSTTMLHAVVLGVSLCIAWAGLRRFRALDRSPFPPPRPSVSTDRRGWISRLLHARATGWAVSGPLLLLSLAAFALLAAASFISSQPDALVLGALFVVFPVSIALMLIRRSPGPATVSSTPGRRRLGFALAGLIGAAILFGAYHWGERPARDLLALRIEVVGVQAAIKGDHEAAIREYDRALTIDPDLVDALAKRAQSNTVLQRYDRALADLDHALRLQPKNVALLVQSSDVRRQIHADIDAVADLDRALTVTPNDPAVLAARALAESEMGDDVKATADVAHAVELNPRQPNALKIQAELSLRAGDYDRARRSLEDALRVNSGDVDALFSRGRLWFYEQDAGKAAADLERASAVFGVPYPALWLFLARARTGIDGRAELAARTQRWPSGNWPYPVIQQLLGKMSAAEARAAATDDDQRCEADFYNGELLLGQDATAPALASLRLAAGECPLGFIEREGALAELRRLDRPASGASPELNSPVVAPPAALAEKPLGASEAPSAVVAPSPAQERETATGAAPASVSRGATYNSGNAVWSLIDRGAGVGELDAVLLFSNPSIHGELSLKRTLSVGDPRYELRFKILASDRIASPFSELGAGLAMPQIEAYGLRSPLAAPSEFQRLDDTTYRMFVPSDSVAGALSRLAAGTKLTIQLAPYGCRCMALSFDLNARTAPVFRAAANAWR